MGKNTGYFQSWHFNGKGIKNWILYSLKIKVVDTFSHPIFGEITNIRAFWDRKYYTIKVTSINEL